MTIGETETSTVPTSADRDVSTPAPRPRQGRRAGRLRTWWQPLVASVVAIGIWQLVAEYVETNATILPKPIDVLRSLRDNRSALWDALGPTAYETIAGFLIAVVAGGLVGILLGNSKILRSVLMPLIVGFQLVPKVALAPLFIVWFGFGNQPKILLTVLICFFPIVINTYAGIQSVTSEQRELGELLRFSRFKMYRHIQARVALPAIFNGLKVAITLAVIGAVVAEFVAADKGLGYLLVTSQTNLNTALMFADVVVLTVFGAVLYGAIVILEFLSIPWHISRRGPA